MPLTVNFIRFPSGLQQDELSQTLVGGGSYWESLDDVKCSSLVFVLNED